MALLRRSLRVKNAAEAQVREINASLEYRVAARTTELEATQNELRHSLDQERELSELKSRFVTMVSHEFRTPLGVTMSALELLQHYDERLPKERRSELCDDIRTSTKSMSALMEQMLVLGRVEAGKLSCCPAPLDLDALAAKLTDESMSATHRKCEILWQPQGSLAGAEADEAILRHVFGNLLANAVKYSSANSTVLFTGRRDGNDAVFEVIDQGIGIPESERDHLFEAFHRCSNVGETPGTGLGLVIVKRFVNLHGGTLTMHSTVGQGTRFTVSLPVFASAPIPSLP